MSEDSTDAKVLRNEFKDETSGMLSHCEKRMVRIPLLQTLAIEAECVCDWLTSKSLSTDTAACRVETKRIQ